MSPISPAPEALKDCEAEGLPSVAVKDVSEPLILMAGAGIYEVLTWKLAKPI